MKIINLAEYVKSKNINKEFANERKPLYVSYNEGKITGDKSAETLGDRLKRIRTTLDKINDIMVDLKRLAAEQTTAKQLKNKLDK